MKLSEIKKIIKEEVNKKPYIRIMYDKPFNNTTIQGVANDGNFREITVKGNYEDFWKEEYKDDDIDTAIRKIKNSIKNYQILEQKSGDTIQVSSADKFKVKHGGKTWIVQYENHEEGEPITLKSGNEIIKGKVTKVTPNGDLTIEL